MFLSQQLFNHQQELRIAEKQKFQFDRETEKLKVNLFVPKFEKGVFPNFYFCCRTNWFC